MRVKEKPLKSAKIYSLDFLLRKLFDGKTSNGIYYLLDEEGYEKELLTMSCDLLIDKYKENPKYKVSFYKS